MSASRIEVADEAEERAAADALRATQTRDDLVSVWWRECDHFEGEARSRLQDIYDARLVKYVPLARAG